jgi:asparagine synthase (glutamine-hydrolysing)
VFAERAAADEAAEPRGFAGRLAYWRSLRATRLGFQSLELLARDSDVRLVHPIADDAFTAALANVVPHDGYRSRGELMARALGDALPPEVLRRGTKASFDEAFWGPESRSLASRWSGQGADVALVDAAGLRREWSRPVPESHTFTLLQAAWLELGEQR